MKKKTYVKAKKKTTLEKLSRFLLVLSFVSFLLATVFSSYPLVALIWNILAPKTSTQLAKVLAKPIETSQFKKTETELDLPEKDKDISETPKIIISKIGVNTEIHEQPSESFEVALRKGVWRVPNFGTPLESTKPMILVAHRFGYLNWDQEYREKNSFFNLPKLDVGDKIEVIWDQRKFLYEIYEKEQGQEISHYSSDLILYTCRFFNSDIRIFRYARRIQ